MKYVKFKLNSKPNFQREKMTILIKVLTYLPIYFLMYNIDP